MSDAHDLSAAELVSLIRAGELSAVEATQAHLERILSTDALVRAWEMVDAQGALEQARQVDRRLRAGAPAGALSGLPIGVKDVIDVRDLPTGAGFAPWRSRTAAEDAVCVHVLREAGAVVIGKTVTVQFAWADDPAETRNPRDLTRTPGGSSSGSAAAVAARQVPVAIGTQTGGSLLRPAGYCGVVGLKPSYGWISNAGVLPTSWSADHVGLLTRSISDAALVHRAMASGGRTATADTPPRFGVVTDLVERAEPSVRSGFGEALDRLRDAGATVVETRLPVRLDVLLAIFSLISCGEGATVHAGDVDLAADAMRAGARAVAEAGQLIPAPALVHARRLRERLRGRMDSLTDGFAALLTPTVSGPPPNREETTGPFDLQTPWSLFGYPTLALPFDAGGPLPASIQVIGAMRAESRLLETAAWIERHLPPPAPVA